VGPSGPHKKARGVNFRRGEPGGHCPALRLVSVDGRWELGFALYASGMRLRMGRAGRPPSVLDFCMGHDVSLYPAILAAVLKRLDPVPETADHAAIDAVFPWARTRPDLAVHLDLLLADPGSPETVSSEKPPARRSAIEEPSGTAKSQARE